MEKFEEITKPVNKIETEPTYHFKEVFRELESLIFPLIEKLKENIDKGEYDMLIGDDASGRIPTLVLRGIINVRNRKLHPELKPSEAETKTRFVAGGRVENDKELKSALEKLKLEVKKKALVVTEYIHTGKSIKRFSNILKELGIPFDIATLKSEFESESDKDNFIERFSNVLKDLGEFLGVITPKPEEPKLGTYNIKIPRNSNFFYGEGSYDSCAPPLIYNVPELSGVVKDKDSESKPYVISSVKKLASEAERRVAQEKINNAREDINLLVKKMLEKVWGDTH